MKKTTITIVALLFAVTLISCKKDYTCSGFFEGAEYTYDCADCSKKERDDYKKQIESNGYSDVSCSEK